MSGTLLKMLVIPYKIMAKPCKMLSAPCIMLAATHLMFVKDQRGGLSLRWFVAHLLISSSVETLLRISSRMERYLNNKFGKSDSKLSSLLHGLPSICLYKLPLVYKISSRQGLIKITINLLNMNWKTQSQVRIH